MLTKTYELKDKRYIGVSVLEVLSFPIIPGNNYENFESLIAAMSETGDAAISFQLFPTALSDSERAIINELTNELLQFSTGTVINNGRVYKDVAATEPSKFYTYYNERKAYPFFLYNLLVFGSSETCKRLSSKLISFLQSGTDKVNSAEFACVDLTNEKVDLVKSFPNYVWNINAKLQYQYRDLRYQKVIPFAAYLKRMPYLLSLDEAATFFKLPLYEESMFALKNDAIYQTHEQFADEVVDGSGIVFGEATANGAKVSVGCPESYFAKHAMIVGSPGSGKTTFSVGLLLQFYKKKIPFLAIEPTKSEYRAMIDVIPELQIFTPGKNHVSPFILNPFIPPRGIRVEQYIPSLASAFKAAFSMPNPLDIAFLKSIKECYLQYGWKDYSVVGDKGTSVFGLYEFILFFKEKIKNIYSDPTVRGRMESAGVLRLSNLIEQNSNIYDTVNSISIEDMLTKPTVLELNAIENSEQKALLMALILIMVCVYTYNHQAGDGELKNILLIDEAHVLLGNNRNVLNSENKADSEGAAVRALEDMIAAIRSYGTGIIIADQSAVSIGRRIVANTDIKVAFRLVESAEKEIIADSSNMGTKEKEQLSRLESGEAFVYHHKLSTAQMIRSEDIRKENNIRLVVSDQEIAKRMTYWSTRKALLRPYHECELCKSCVRDCDFILRSDADYIAAKALRKYRKGIVDDGVLTGYSGNSTVLVIPNSVRELAPEAFKNNKYLEEVVLPDGLKTIPQGLFSGCEKLKKVCIPATVTAIDSEAFYYCRSLEKVDIPPMVTAICRRTFEWCDSLEEIDIHSNVRVIDHEAFSFSGLKKVGLHTGLKTIGVRAFEETHLEEVVLPEDLEEIYGGAFYKCMSLKRVVLPNNAVNIVTEAWAYDYVPSSPWQGCSNIDSINFHKGLDANLFYGTKFMRERLPKHTCPCCGGKIGFFNDCKSCGWDAPDKYWTWR